MSMFYVVGALAVLAILFALKKGMASRSIYTKFDLSKSTHKLISSDLGGDEAKIRLSHAGVNGIPDAIFAERKGNRLVVGEFKSRTYSGIIKNHELYQMMLYMGHLKLKYPKQEVSGRLAYADFCVSITYDQELYDCLMGMADQYRLVVHYMRSLPDLKPVHAIMPVNLKNGHLRLRPIP